MQDAGEHPRFLQSQVLVAVDSGFKENRQQKEETTKQSQVLISGDEDNKSNKK